MVRNVQWEYLEVPPKYTENKQIRKENITFMTCQVP